MNPLLILCLFVCCLQLASCSAKLHVDRPRGVPLTHKSLYDSSKDFTCLDGSSKIPFAWVNDDYCDCVDGSDEPGTSACPTSKFHCVNLGHSPLNLPSSRVNDQICDCCDGSDEYAGFVNCPNTCDEIGRAAREEAQRRAVIAKEGYQTRLQLAKDGQHIVAEKKKRLDEVQKVKDDLDPVRDELELQKENLEKLEKEAKDKHQRQFDESQKRKKASEAFATLDKDRDQRITPQELLNRMEFDKDSDGVVTEQEALDHLSGKTEVDLEQFIAEIWEQIEHVYKPDNDEVTPAPQPPSIEPNTDVTPAPPTDIPPYVVPPPPEKEYNEDEEEEEVTEDEVEDFDSEKYMKDGENVDNIASDEPMPEYDEATKKLISDADALRREFGEVDKKVKDAESEIKSIQAFLSQDYGYSFEFASLATYCYELTDSQYLYKICMFGKTTQRNKDGGSETNLGEFSSWDGPENDKYSKQKYTGGLSCWNGPERSCQVTLSCGLETKLKSAYEPSRCEYAFELETPVVCAESVDIHEEL